MANRIYPANAPLHGAAVLTGAGSVNDIFTFPYPVLPVLQNNTSASVEVICGLGTPIAAAQGDEVEGSGGEFVAIEQATWISVYGVAGTKVNGTTAGLFVYAFERVIA